MDMEADLGIDSIKRVEIFGAMTAAHPEPQPNDAVNVAAPQGGWDSAPATANATKPAAKPVATKVLNNGRKTKKLNA